MEQQKKQHQGAREVPTTDLGLYVWIMPSGQLLGDGEGHYLAIAAKKGDERKISTITTTAHGVLKDNQFEPLGKPLFLPGRRMITDEEDQEQRARLALGLVPDPYDVPAIKESLDYKRKFHD